MLVAQANVWRMTGDYQAAEQALAHALAISRDLNAAGLEAEVLNATGLLRYSRGDLASAKDFTTKHYTVPASSLCR